MSMCRQECACRSKMSPLSLALSSTNCLERRRRNTVGILVSHHDKHYSYAKVKLLQAIHQCNKTLRMGRKNKLANHCLEMGQRPTSPFPVLSPPHQTPRMALMQPVACIESATSEISSFISAPPLRFEGHCVTECPWSAPAARTVHLRCKVYGEATIVWYAPHYSDVPIDEHMPRPGQTGRYTIQASYDQL